MIKSIVIAVAAVSILAIAVIREVYKSMQKSEPSFEEASIAQPMTTPITESELATATGEEGRPLYIAVNDPYSEDITVFDVSKGSDFYGPGGPYHVFTGKNATHGLATSSTDPEQATGDLSDLTASEKDTHLQWYEKYSMKYPIVGRLVPDNVGTSKAEVSATTEESKKDA